MKSINDIINEAQVGGKPMPGVKRWRDVKDGDTLYGVYIPWNEKPRAEKFEVKVKSAEIIDEPDVEGECADWGRSNIEFAEKVYDNYRLVPRQRELSNTSDSFHRGIICTTKEERDNWYDKFAQDTIKRIEKEQAESERVRKELAEIAERNAKGIFKSYGEEVGYWEDYYDHEGSPEMLKRWDKELEEKIAAAKKKWGVEDDN